MIMNAKIAEIKLGIWASLWSLQQPQQEAIHFKEEFSGKNIAIQFSSCRSFSRWFIGVQSYGGIVIFNELLKFIKFIN